ncbi:hypothetical protein P152DRAFT_460855 [Eremomyces bilateralis CBS 781.70]|uniref:Uncharacterized protein n=1 Tax=Eremomyces bilateralis CBS 781.70 TaxID=1392243 RepID=A0A6G1FWD1_9PEZI|nr:uncharacterized protein P152DRAFT_460855 [Eremomyces bilateralis CBS 781.70]KAF1810038.1 hypothetical protein P152DRAFT_460855 [Eremomyces bilateralis CBS 781.70]
MTTQITNASFSFQPFISTQNDLAGLMIFIYPMLGPELMKAYRLKKRDFFTRKTDGYIQLEHGNQLIVEKRKVDRVRNS